MSTAFDEAVLKWKENLLSSYLDLTGTPHTIENINDIGMQLHKDFVSMSKMGTRERVTREEQSILSEIYDQYLGLYLNEMDRLFVKDVCENYTM